MTLNGARMVSGQLESRIWYRMRDATEMHRLMRVLIESEVEIGSVESVLQCMNG